MIVSASSVVQHVIQIKKWNNKTCQYVSENDQNCKKDYSLNPSTGTFENSKYLKKVADTSVIKCDEIIFVMDIVSIKMTYSNKCANNI